MQTRKLVTKKTQVVIQKNEARTYSKILPIELQYYLIITQNQNDLPRYGVGIEKITEEHGTTICEQKWIDDVFTQKSSCESLLHLLASNLVFPANLREIVLDTIA